MARTSVENTVERIRRQLASTVRLEISTLGSSLTTTTNPVTLSYDLPNSLRAGSVLAIGTELMRVISVSTAAKEATVIRGWQDTDAQAHDIGDEVQINPRFTFADIYDAMIQEIDSWAPDIFKVEDDVFATTDATAGVEIPADQADILGVISVNRNWTDDASVVWPDTGFTLYRGRSSSLTPDTGSGLVVRFTRNLGFAETGNVYIQYANPYDTSLLTFDGDFVTDLGMVPNQLEIVELGVKYRVLADDETGRSARGPQDEPRRAEEVQSGDVLTLAQTVLQRYNTRKAQEVRRLRSAYTFQTW